MDREVSPGLVAYSLSLLQYDEIQCVWSKIDVRSRSDKYMNESFIYFETDDSKVSLPTSVLA